MAISPVSLLSPEWIILFLGIFLLSWLLTPYWGKIARKAGLAGQDMHKLLSPQIPEMGGVIVLLAFIIGIMGYIAMRIFVFHAETQISLLFASLTAVLLAGIIGMIDDILGWKIGLRQWQKPLLTLLVAAPIIAINAGTRVMSIPLIGKIDLGLLYPLFIIPTIILIGTNGFNMLAGYNGLEAGQGMIILAALAYASFMTSSSWVAVLALCMAFALLGFWLHNRFPAKIFPGDTLTYSVGAVIAIVAILANREKMFLILFIPYIIEFFLKLRGLFQKESFAQVTENGTLTLKYDRIYGLEHLAIRTLQLLHIPPTERKVVYSLHGFQLCCVALAFIL